MVVGNALQNVRRLLVPAISPQWTGYERNTLIRWRRLRIHHPSRTQQACTLCSIVCWPTYCSYLLRLCKWGWRSVHARWYHPNGGTRTWGTCQLDTCDMLRRKLRRIVILHRKGNGWGNQYAFELVVSIAYLVVVDYTRP